MPSSASDNGPASGGRDTADGSMLDAALTYLARGWAVIPVRPRGKRPIVPWEELQRRRPTEKEVRGWFERWPDANLAIVTGRVSGLIVLDVDPRHDGDETLDELEQSYGPLPHTAEAITGSGGRHVYFAYPGRMVRNAVGFAPGLDIRGDGGVIVAPPSVHPSGRRYEWEVSHHPDETPVVPMPRWLLRLATMPADRRGHPLEHWRRLAREGVKQGRRNDTIASFAGHLFWHGVDYDVVMELLLCWNARRCRPPLDDDEVMRTVDSIARTHFREEGSPEPQRE